MLREPANRPSVVRILSLTTLRELFRLSLPMVVSQGSFAVMIFTDRWFMSHLDAAHIAATLGGGVASAFCLSLFIGLITYANALVAQYYGAGATGEVSPGSHPGPADWRLAASRFCYWCGYFGGRVFRLPGPRPGPGAAGDASISRC